MVYDDEEDFTGDETEDGADEEAAQGLGTSGEGNKISIAESVILVLIAASSDLFELLAAFAAAVPIVGWGVWALAFLFGLIASTIIFLWTFLRSVKGNFVTRVAIKKIVTMALGTLIDAITGGVLPLRTAALLLVIWLHNRAAEKDGDRLAAAIRRAIALASKI